MRAPLAVAVLALSPALAWAQTFGDAARPHEVGEIQGHPLPDWVQSGTGTSAQLDHACDRLGVELTLSGQPLRNYLNVAIENPTRLPVALLPDEIMVRFSSGLARRLVKLTPGDLRIEPGYIASAPLAFPYKGDFHGQEWLTVETTVSIGEDRCTFETRFRRDPQVGESPGTVTSYRRFEVAMTGGAIFVPHGPLKDVTPAVAWGLELNTAYFFTPAHGLTLDFGGEDWGSRAARRASPDLGGNKVDLNNVDVMLGYAFRPRALSWLIVSLEPAVGLAWFQIGRDNSVVTTSDPVATARARGRLLVPIFDNCFAGLALDYHRFLGGHLGAAHLSGGTVNASLVLGVGY
jgi:hypothetical protein